MCACTHGRELTVLSPMTTDAYLSVFRFGPVQFAFSIFIFYTAGEANDPTAVGIVVVSGITAILTAVPCIWPRLRNSMAKQLPNT